MKLGSFECNKKLRENFQLTWILRFKNSTKRSNFTVVMTLTCNHRISEYLIYQQQRILIPVECLRGHRVLLLESLNQFLLRSPRGACCFESLLSMKLCRLCTQSLSLSDNWLEWDIWMAVIYAISSRASQSCFAKRLIVFHLSKQSTVLLLEEYSKDSEYRG